MNVQIHKIQNKILVFTLKKTCCFARSIDTTTSNPGIPTKTARPGLFPRDMLGGWLSWVFYNSRDKNRVGDDGGPAILQCRSSDLYLTDRKEIRHIPLLES